MTVKVVLDGEHLTMEDVIRVAGAPAKGETVEVVLSAQAVENVQRAEKAVAGFVRRGEIVYGVTTGFGAFKDRIIPPDQVRQLQRNILMSHAVGVGPPLDEMTTRAMMLIRANTLAKGYSGIREETLRLLLDMLNQGIHPVVPCQGSLGASGDLAPLAHMSLPLIGLGEVHYQGRVLPGAEAMDRAGLSPIVLEAKEGLALTNGTAFMAAVGVLTSLQAENLACVADVAGALSLEALHGTPAAFDERIHAVRPHPRQIECATFIRQLVRGSDFVRENDPLDVQDAYTLRCIPQVHGAVHEAIWYARGVLEIELNAATDNPLIFFDADGAAVVLSGGNFHGEPLAIAMDYLALALAELGNMSERRLTRLTDEASNQETLPAFLIKHGGLNSGFMLTQYTAAALASENKVLAHPASVDTIPTSANTEDHVSMGAVAARQAHQIVDNVERILAIELFAAAQGIDFRRIVLGPDAKLGEGTAPAWALIRQHVPFLENDAVMYPHIETIRQLIANGELIQAVHKALPEAHSLFFDRV
ncbi:MAG: histidine ammonia-lyase [Anaerolineae bacterium]|nr:histidine ammonia-lyase [Anaerolineae bacterium]